MHSFPTPIIHGDLNCVRHSRSLISFYLTKSQNNILLDEDYTARLADFGYASLVGDIPEALTYLQRSTTLPGALRWIAPEQIDPEKSYNRTTKSDIYSFGCVALQGSYLHTNAAFALIFSQVLSGKQPWSEVRQDAAVVLHLAKGQKPGRPESATLHDSHWDLMQWCWSPVEERPPADVIVSLIQQLLSNCPKSQAHRDTLVLWSSEARTMEETEQQHP